MLTNQVHQWAHMPAPPPVVRWLQDCGVLLDAIGFFRTLEALVSMTTGARPREDDRRYASE